jgi:hypothetical protein
MFSLRCERPPRRHIRPSGVQTFRSLDNSACPYVRTPTPIHPSAEHDDEREVALAKTSMRRHSERRAGWRPTGAGGASRRSSEQAGRLALCPCVWTHERIWKRWARGRGARLPGALVATAPHTRAAIPALPPHDNASESSLSPTGSQKLFPHGSRQQPLPFSCVEYPVLVVAKKKG